MQSRQIVRQGENATDQGFDDGGVWFSLAAQNRLGQRLGLARQHGGAVEFNHLQGTEYLMQVGRAESQLALVGGVLGVRLKRETRLFEGLVDLGLDPAEGIRIDLALRAHELSDAHGARRPVQAAGNLKPATDACNSRASSESLPIDSAVWRVPVEVKVVAS